MEMSRAKVIQESTDGLKAFRNINASVYVFVIDRST